MSKKVTIKDIARIAGVSHSTVSRSLNDSSMISEKTKNMIKKIARDMNFEFNASARSLSTRKTGTIAVVFNERYEAMGTSIYLNRLLREIHRSLEKDSMDNLIINPLNSYTRSSNIKRVIQMQKIDGLLIFTNKISGDDWDVIQNSGLPYLIIHFKPVNTTYNRMNYIFSDHEYGGYLATEHLISNGCSNILCVTENSNELQFIERTSGYRKALSDNGLAVNERYVITGECTYDYGYQLVMDRQGMLPEIDGIFSQADIMALGIMEGLKDLGYDIPGQIRVVGYDDIEFSSYFRPNLTTVHQPGEQMVADACSHLVALIKDEDKQLPLFQEVIRPTLIIRESC